MFISQNFYKTLKELLDTEISFCSAIENLVNNYRSYLNYLSETEFATLKTIIIQYYAPLIANPFKNLHDMPEFKNLDLKAQEGVEQTNEITCTQIALKNILDELKKIIEKGLSLRVSYVYNVSKCHPKIISFTESACKKGLQTSSNFPTLTNELIAPVKRFPLYALFITSLLENCPDDPEIRQTLELCNIKMREILQNLNEALKQDKISLDSIQLEEAYSLAVKDSRDRQLIRKLVENNVNCLFKALTPAIWENAIALETALNACRNYFLKYCYGTESILNGNHHQSLFNERYLYLKLLVEKLGTMDPDKWNIFTNLLNRLVGNTGIRNSLSTELKDLIKDILRMKITNESYLKEYQIEPVLLFISSYFFLANGEDQYTDNLVRLIQLQEDLIKKQRVMDTLSESAKHYFPGILSEEAKSNRNETKIVLSLAGRDTTGFQLAEDIAEQNNRRWANIEEEIRVLTSEITGLQSEIISLKHVILLQEEEYRSSEYQEKYPLHAAAMQGNIEGLVTLLMGQGFNRGHSPNKGDHHRRKAIYYSVISGHFEAFKLLFEYTYLEGYEEENLREITKQKAEEARDNSIRKRYQDIYNFLLDPYEKLWLSNDKTLHPARKIANIFEDYYAIFSFKSITNSLLLREKATSWIIHRGRKYSEYAKSIVNELDKYTRATNRMSWDISQLDYIISYLKRTEENILRAENTKPYNRNGSFAKRLNYVLVRMLPTLQQDTLVLSLENSSSVNTPNSTSNYAHFSWIFWTTPLASPNLREEDTNQTTTTLSERGSLMPINGF